jgi:hypothetical protein
MALFDGGFAPLQHRQSQNQSAQIRAILGFLFLIFWTGPPFRSLQEKRDFGFAPQARDFLEQTSDRCSRFRRLHQNARLEALALILFSRRKGCQIETNRSFPLTFRGSVPLSEALLNVQVLRIYPIRATVTAYNGNTSGASNCSARIPMEYSL